MEENIDVTIYPTKVDDKFQLLVDSWQLVEITSALAAMNKRRDYNKNKYRKNKEAKVGKTKPRLLIGPTIMLTIKPPSPKPNNTIDKFELIQLIQNLQK